MRLAPAVVALGIALSLPTARGAADDDPVEAGVKSIRKDLRRAYLKTAEKREVYRAALARLGDLVRKNVEAEAWVRALDLYMEAGFRSGDFPDLIEMVDWAIGQKLPEKKREELLLYKGRSLARLIRFKEAQEVLEPLREGPEARGARKALAALEKSRSEKAVVGRPAPDFNFRSVDGRMVNLSHLRGKVVLIHFWATWCGTSRETMPRMISIHSEFAPQGLEVIGVSLDRDEKSLKRYLKENDITWPQYFDGRYKDNYLAKYYGVEETPANFLIDPSGKISRTNLIAQEMPIAIGGLLRSR